MIVSWLGIKGHPQKAQWFTSKNWIKYDCRKEELIHGLLVCKHNLFANDSVLYTFYTAWYWNIEECVQENKCYLRQYSICTVHRNDKLYAVCAWAKNTPQAAVRSLLFYCATDREKNVFRFPAQQRDRASPHFWGKPPLLPYTDINISCYL